MKLLGSVLAGAVLVVCGQAHAKDWVWEMTTRMEMPGMPKMAGMPGMGAQKNTSCVAEGKEAESSSKQQPDCKVTDQSSSGKISRMTIQCKEGTMKMEHEMLGPDHWRSKMETSGGRKGEEMTIYTEARRLGPCDAAKDGSLSKEMQAQLGEQAKMAKARADEMGKQCQEAVAKWPGNADVFNQYEQSVKTRQTMLGKNKGPDAMKMADASAPEVPFCGEAKGEYCAKAKATYGEMGNRQGYAAVMKRSRPSEGIARALAYCGAGDAAPLRGKHCKSAVSEADYGFVAGFCPEERKVLARQYCAGRSYTAIEPKYRALCGGGSGGSDYAGSDGVAGSGSSATGSAEYAGSRKSASSGGNSAPAEQPAPAQPGKDLQSEVIDQGVKVLKGFLKF